MEIGGEERKGERRGAEMHLGDVVPCRAETSKSLLGPQPLLHPVQQFK